MSGYLQDELELDLLALGGEPLYADAHDEAGAHVDEQYPWDGRGDEPPERVAAYLAVLWQRAEQAAPNSPPGHGTPSDPCRGGWVGSPGCAPRPAGRSTPPGTGSAACAG